MTISLNLPRNVQQKLELLAKRRGQSIERVVNDLVQQAVDGPTGHRPSKEPAKPQSVSPANEKALEALRKISR